MALSPRYVLRETGQNLWRNILSSAAAVITIGVSLWLFGGFFLFNYAVDNATSRWEGGIEFVIWMEPDASQNQTDSIRDAIDNNPAIRDWTYVDQEQTFEEFRELFADEPELIQDASPEILPPSFRVVPANSDADVVVELASQFQDRPGVAEVVSADQTIRDIQRLADQVTRVFLVGSVILLTAATLLILTNIVSAIRSRGAEIEIMKVVGATNWFIRVPFMLEGLVQAILGAMGAWIGLIILDDTVIRGLSRPDSLQLMQGFQVNQSEFLTTSLLVLVIAIVVSGIGSAVAVTKYLEV